MSDWASINYFLDHLGPPTAGSFEDWFGPVWQDHYSRCRSAAVHTYVLHSAVTDADSLESLRELLASKALECGLIPAEFVEYAWERAVQQFKVIHDE